MIKLDDGSRVYEVVVVTDLDHDSKDATGNNWYSYVKRGVITINKELTKASVVWQDGKEVISSQLRFSCLFCRISFSNVL